MNFEEAFMNMKKTPAFSEYTHWQELQDRILVINEEVDEFMVENYIMPIIKWNKEDDEADLKALEEGKPFTPKTITIYLNSPGGDMFVGLVLAEVIKKSKTPVHIIVLSLAASMGSVILSAGHKRSGYKFSNVLIHDGQTGIGGTTNKVKDTMKFFEEKEAQLRDFIVANTKITAELYEDKKDREWWLSAEKALELGLLDEIIE